MYCLKSALTTVFVTAAIVTLPATAALADRIDDAIKARQGYYQMVAFNFGGLVAMAKGEAEYDAKTAQTFANNMKALTELDVGAMWPQGSDKEARAGKTRALPAIWTTFPAIAEKSTAFKDAVAELASVAGDGQQALGPMIGKVGGTCSACHKEFRAKDF